MAGSPQAAFAAAAAGGGGFPIMKMLVPLGIAALSIGGYFVKTALFGTGGKNSIGYAQLGIDPKKADPDKMITSVGGAATRWKKDATWWSVNIQKVGADGMADCSEGGCQVQYASLSSATSAAQSVNKDSVKEFAFGPMGVSYNNLIGTAGGKPWKDPKAPPTAPGCSIKMLIDKQIKGKGLTAGKHVRVTYDASSSFGPVDAWRVMGDDPKIDGYYSMANCSPMK